MIMVKSRQFREHMLHYLEMIARGHRVVITRHNEPIAEIKLPADNSVIRASVLYQPMNSKLSKSA